MYLTPEETAKELGISVRTLKETVAKRPDFPPRHIITKRVYFWRLDDIEKYKSRCRENK